MSLEIALREMVRRELALQLSPLQKAIGRMEKGLDALDALRSFATQIKPLANRIGTMAGLSALGVAPVERIPARRGRPPGSGRKMAAAAPPARPQKATRARAAEEGRPCAVIGCGRAARSKGYCSAHYQKLRLLTKTNRRPADWVDDARANSVQDVKLPRGRAAAKALQEAAPPKPATPPKPKAWLRKKGQKGGMVSLT